MAQGLHVSTPLELLLPVLLSTCAQAADSATTESQLREEHQWREEMSLSLAMARPRYSTQSTSEECLSLPLPESPGDPRYSMTDSTDDEELRLVFWRETCSDGSGTALLVRVTPVIGSPFLCSSALAIVQDGVQRNDIRLQSAADSSSSWCNDLYAPTTLIVNQYEFGEPQFDPAQSLTVYYDTYPSSISVNVPTDAAPAPNVSAALRGYARSWGSCTNVTTGQTVPVSARNQYRTVSCKAAGLRINSGDRVRMTLTGTAN